ncbi:MAG: alpha/beta hydrolase [Pseudomonadota bacterium]
MNTREYLTDATKAFFDSLEQSWKASPPKALSATSINEYRENARNFFESTALPAEDAQYECITIPTMDGQHISANVYHSISAKKGRGVLIFYPGGAFIAKLGAHHSPISHIANKTDCCIIVPDCRLAPENKFPTGLHDAFCILNWVYKKGTALYGIDPNKIIVGGDSSGGNFAALTAIYARDNNISLLCQILISPITDLSRSLTSFKKEEQQDILTSPEFVEWAYQHYFPNGFNRKSPQASFN